MDRRGPPGGGAARRAGERGERTIATCLKIASAFPLVVVAMMYGHLWTRRLEWVGLVEGVMRQIAGS